MDHWENSEETDVLGSIRRRNLGRRYLQRQNNKLTINQLWDLMSKPPILNSLTIYATYMLPAAAYYETRLPEEDSGSFTRPNERIKEDVDFEKELQKFKIEMKGKMLRCANCYKLFNSIENKLGQCSHSGEWVKKETKFSMGKFKI